MRLSLVLCFAAGALAAQGPPDPALSAGPMGAWIMVPGLPGMGRRVDAVATAARRHALMSRIGRGVVLIPAAHERDVESDYVRDNDFRQHNTFFYFTELETEDAWLLMSTPAPDSIDVILFLPPGFTCRTKGWACGSKTTCWSRRPAPNGSAPGWPGKRMRSSG